MVNVASVVEASHLLSTLKHNIHETLSPSEELFDIDLLLENLRIYSKRVQGESLSDEEYRIEPHRDFAGLVVTPRERTYNSLLRRLKVIIRFNITSYEKVSRDLLHGLVSEQVDRLSGREIRLLSLLYQRPNTPQAQMAKELEVSLPTMRKDIRTLEEKIGLRFANLIDWGRFKIKPIALFFNTKSLDASRSLERIFENEMSPYLVSASFDTTMKRGFAGFRVPDQGKPLQLFQEQLHFLNDNLLENSQIHEVKKYYQSICFDHFDYDTSTWLIEGDVLALGLLNFVRENWTILPKPRGLSVTLARPFDKLDYYLASFLVGDARAPMQKIQKRLASVGITIPRTTVSTRKTRLQKEGTLEPYFVFGTPQLPFFITFAIRCDPHIAEQLVVAVAQMPLAFAQVTNIGCFVNVSVPSRSLGNILNLLSRTIEEDGVHEVWQMQQFRNLGSASPAMLAEKWNGSYWNWSEEEFAIPSVNSKF